MTQDRIKQLSSQGSLPLIQTDGSISPSVWAALFHSYMISSHQWGRLNKDLFSNPHHAHHNTQRERMPWIPPGEMMLRCLETMILSII